jgi:hypothetical protein
MKELGLRRRMRFEWIWRPRACAPEAWPVRGAVWVTDQIAFASLVSRRLTGKSKLDQTGRLFPIGVALAEQAGFRDSCSVRNPASTRMDRQGRA